MEYAGQDYIKKTGTGRVRPEALEGVAQQYIECANYLVGAKGIDEILRRLEFMIGRPTGEALEAIKTKVVVDTYTSATIRAGKIRSAVIDAFNRGVYQP